MSNSKPQETADQLDETDKKIFSQLKKVSKEDLFKGFTSILAVLETYFKDAEEWVKSTNAETRGNLAEIIEQYGKVLQATKQFATEAGNLAVVWKAAVKSIERVISLYKATKEEEAHNLYKSIDISCFQKGIPQERIDLLMKQYELLLQALHTESTRLQKDIKEANKRKWIFIGIAAISVLVLIGCVALTAVSFGAAAPAAVAAGAVASETVMTVTSGAAFGLWVGVTGAVAAAATATSATVMALTVETMKNNATDLCKTYKDTAKQVKLLKEGSVQKLIDSLQELQLLQQITNKTTLPALEVLYSQVVTEVDLLQTNVNNLKRDVDNHRTNYVNKLIDLQITLQYEQPKSCIIQ